jgi:hypothetical protein
MVEGVVEQCCSSHCGQSQRDWERDGLKKRHTLFLQLDPVSQQPIQWDQSIDEVNTLTVQSPGNRKCYGEDPALNPWAFAGTLYSQTVTPYTLPCSVALPLGAVSKPKLLHGLACHTGKMKPICHSKFSLTSVCKWENWGPETKCNLATQQVSDMC